MYKRSFAIAIGGLALLCVVILSSLGSSAFEVGGPSTLLGTDGFRDSLATDIRNAKKFVYATTYLVEAYPNNAIVNELEAAKLRGVDIRLMFDYHTLEQYPSIRQDLQIRGIPFKVISSHAKLAVIDNKIAYVGSSNLNRNGLEENYELDLRSSTPSTVTEAYQYLDRLWKNGEKPVVDEDHSPERFVNGQEFYKLLIENLKTANSVKVLTYVTSYNYLDSDAPDSIVLNEVKNAHDRGAALELVIDDSEYQNSESARAFLINNNVPHRLDENYTKLEILHAKAFLIDDKILFVGSHNLDQDSLNSSQEVSIMTTDPKVISSFLQMFGEKWDSSIEPRPDVNGTGSQESLPPE